MMRTAPSVKVCAGTRKETLPVQVSPSQSECDLPHVGRCPRWQAKRSSQDGHHRRGFKRNSHIKLVTIHRTLVIQTCCWLVMLPEIQSARNLKKQSPHTQRIALVTPMRVRRIERPKTSMA